MFSAARIILRKTDIRNYSKTFSKVDPGIHWRKKFLQSNEEEEDYDDLESDFMDAHKTHKDHLKETEYMHERQKYHIVRQKYFKEKYPNFLTWNDKEQIKYLHSTDPEEWTVDRLSEGFPALPDVITKIIKAKWDKNARKVKNHDLAVQKNWDMFKTGQIPDLPSELVQHLHKFTNRALNLKPSEAPQDKKVIEVRTRKNKNTEFSDIISSYEKLRNKGEKKAEGTKVSLPEPRDSSNTYLTVPKDKMRNTKSVTLQVLQGNIEKKVDRGKDLSPEDKLMFKSLEKHTGSDEEVSLQKYLEISTENNNNIEVSEHKIIDIAKKKYEAGTSVMKTNKDYSHLMYPEKITIPKEIRKRGHTYKLNDCYYDYDGTFLYRVPGMG